MPRPHDPRSSRRFAPVLAMLFALTAEAHATGGFQCRADDGVLGLEVGSAVTRGLGGGILRLDGRLELRTGPIPVERRTMDLRPENLAQSWFRDRELRLSLRVERRDAIVDLVVLTREIEEGSYGGEYALSITDPMTPERSFDWRGPVSCMVE